MANTLYPSGKEAILNKEINFSSDTIKAALVTSVYAGADVFVNPGILTERLNTDQTLATPSITAGVFNADNVTWTAVTGAQIQGVVLYMDTGLDTTSKLIAYIDTITGFPLTPNGGNITVQWDDGAYKIFSL